MHSNNANPYRDLIRQILTSTTEDLPHPVRAGHEERKMLLFKSLGAVRKEILKTIKELKKQMPGLVHAEHVPHLSHDTVEYHFISAARKYCRAEFYVWPSQGGGIFYLHGLDGNTETYTFGKVVDLCMSPSPTAVPLENKNPAEAIAVHVAKNLGRPEGPR